MLNLYNILHYGSEIVFFTIAIVLLVRIARAIQTIGDMFDVFAQLTFRKSDSGPPKS